MFWWIILIFSGAYDFKTIFLALLGGLFSNLEWWCYVGALVLTGVPMILWRIRCKSMMTRYERGIATAWGFGAAVLTLFKTEHKEIVQVMFPESGIVLFALFLGGLLLLHWVIWWKAFANRENVNEKWLPTASVCAILLVLGIAAGNFWTLFIVVGLLITHLLKRKGAWVQ